MDGPRFCPAGRPADVVLLGSSQVNSPSWAADARFTKKPVDCLDHREVITLEHFLQTKAGKQGQPKVFNCAMQGGVISDYFMIERVLFQDERKPKVVVLCVSPRDFIDNKLAEPSATEPWRFFSRFINNSSKLTALAYPSLPDRLFVGLNSAVSAIPLRRLSDLISNACCELAEGKKASTPKHGQELAQAIANGHQQVKLGDWVVPADMKTVFVDNSAEYEKRYADPKPKSYGVQISFFRELLRDLNEKGCAVLVVEMPTLPCNRSLLPDSFWAEYRHTLAEICQQSKTTWVDLSTSPDFQKSDYLDTVHLNDRGGIKLFAKLASIISGDERLSARLQPTSLANFGDTY